MWSEGKSADAIIEEQGLEQITDSGAIERVIDEVIAANPKQLADYRGGKDKLFGFFVGQVMKATGGKANPGAAQRAAEDEIGRRAAGFVSMHDRDCLHRFVFEHYPIRGHLVHLDAAWRALIEHRDYPDGDPRRSRRSGGGLAPAGRDHQVRRRALAAAAGRRASCISCSRNARAVSACGVSRATRKGSVRRPPPPIRARGSTI